MLLFLNSKSILLYTFMLRELGLCKLHFSFVSWLPSGFQQPMVSKESRQADERMGMPHSGLLSVLVGITSSIGFHLSKNRYLKFHVCILLHCIALYCILFYSILFYSILLHSILFYSYHRTIFNCAPSEVPRLDDHWPFFRVAAL